MTDSELLSSMERGDLDPTLFNHEAHLRWGWLLLENHGIETAIERACTQLKHYTRRLGLPDKYNETVTIAAMRAIYHFRLKSEKSDFNDFISAFPRLRTSFKELMGFHYSLDIFNNEHGKDNYIEPDLLPFD